MKLSLVFVIVILCHTMMMYVVHANMYITYNRVKKRRFPRKSSSSSSLRSWKMQAKITFQGRQNNLRRIPMIFIQGTDNEIHDDDDGTRGMNATNTARKASVLAFRRTKLVVSSRSIVGDDGKDTKQITWSGTLFDPSSSSNSTNRTGFATIIISPNGDYAGSFTTEYAAYSLIKIKDKYQLRMTRWDDFPNHQQHLLSDEDDPTTTKTTTTTATTGIFPSNSSSNAISQGNNTVIIQQLDRILSKEGSGPIYRRFLNHHDKNRDLRRSKHIRHRLLHENQSTRKLQEETDIVIDVMVAVTNRAMCEYAGQSYGCNFDDFHQPIHDRLPLLEAQTNDAFAAIQDGMSIRIVGVIYLDTPYDALIPDEILKILRTDEYLVSMREAMGADLISMISGGTGWVGGCGSGMVDGCTSVVAYNCLDAYSFTHEMGHNFGANHDRTNSVSQNPYAYAWQDPDRQFRTVMAYDCYNDGGACPRIPYFSSDIDYYNNKPIGNSMNNNARIISENAISVANYMPSVY